MIVCCWLYNRWIKTLYNQSTAWNMVSKIDTDRIHPHDVILIPTTLYDPQISQLLFSTFHLCLCTTRTVTSTSWLLSVPQNAQYNNAVYNDTFGSLTRPVNGYLRPCSYGWYGNNFNETLNFAHTSSICMALSVNRRCTLQLSRKCMAIT